MFAMSYLGANRVVTNYNVMGPVKAALESAVRYVATELGPKGIRVHAVSPGPLATRAASGIRDFDELMGQVAVRAPGRHPGRAPLPAPSKHHRRSWAWSRRAGSSPGGGPACFSSGGRSARPS